MPPFSGVRHPSMADDRAQVIRTLGECLSFMAPYAGGAVPASTDTEYGNWVRWVQLGQQDAANRGFWRRLLTKTDLAITSGDDTVDLPDNFHKVNGIYILEVDGTDWAEPNNEAEISLFVNMDPADGKWQVRFSEEPSANATGTLWYFYNPPVPEDEADPLYLDGEMIGYYALKEYFRRQRAFGSMDDARLEYENRREELLALEVLPSRQELLSWSDTYSHRNITRDERKFYAGRGNRGRWRNR